MTNEQSARDEVKMLWLDGDWNDPFRISDAIEKKYWEQLEKNAKGVYRLIALSNKNDFTLQKLDRVCGVDDTGTLYIGASYVSLLGRLAAVVKTHRPDYVGRPHQRLSPRLADRFTERKLAVSWEPTETPWEREHRLLVAYEETFGELPPMNNQRSVF